MAVITNCGSTKQMQNALAYFGLRLFGKLVWHRTGCARTQWIGEDKFLEYEDWFKRVTAFFVHSDATYKQAEKYFAPKLTGNWWYGCRDTLSGILTVSKEAAEKINEGEPLTSYSLSALAINPEDMKAVCTIKRTNKNSDLQRMKNLWKALEKAA